MYPYSLLFLQNYLVKHEIKSEIIDLYWQSINELLDVIRNTKQPIIGVTAQSHSVLRALDLIRQIKATNNSAIVVVGGNFFSNTHADLLQRYKNIDFVVRGEGEITFYELVKTIRNNGDFDAIDGISFKRDDSVIANRDRKFQVDIEQFALQYEKLPVINRFGEGIPMRNYEKENYRSFPVFLGRGCSRQCVFCEYNQMKYRINKIPVILKEMDYLIKTYKAQYFTFADPSFCERKAFVREFCEVLIEKYPHIKWSCEARVDTPMEILELMAKAGCIGIDFGLESGSEKVLQTIRKKIDLVKLSSFVKTCYNLGIRTHMFLMVSLPGETEADAKLTLKLCRGLSKYVSSMSLGVSQILPGTELETIAISKKLLPANFSYYDEQNYHSKTKFANPHIPLYIESLSFDFIESFFDKMMDIKAQKYDDFSTVMQKAKLGIRSLHKKSFKQNYVYLRRFVFVIFKKIIP